MANGNKWYKFLNEQKYSECQLVSAINAAYYLRGESALPSAETYEKMVDLVKARHGAAIEIEKVYKPLKLRVDKTYTNWHSLYEDIKNRRVRFPIELKIWEKHYGFHSILLVDYEAKSDALRATNFRYQTSLSGWIFAEDLMRFVSEKPITHDGFIAKAYRIKK